MKWKRSAQLLTIGAGALMALWGFGFVPGIYAHEGHKHRHAPKSARRLKNPLPASDENIAAGRALFGQHCAVCHGEDGKAKTEMAASMKVKPADLTDRAMHGITDGEIYWVITNGIKRSGMPAFKAKASDTERWQMALYVKHLMGEHPHAAPGTH
jgi:mono/diheme cytochrome c family protein